MKTKKHFWNNAPVDTAFHLMNYFILIVILLVCAYPLLVIISSSVSDADYVNRGLVTFLPKGFQVKAFELVLRDSRILSGYLNTIFYATVGTLLRVTVTVMAGLRPLPQGYVWAQMDYLVLPCTHVHLRRPDSHLHSGNKPSPYRHPGRHHHYGLRQHLEFDCVPHLFSRIPFQMSFGRRPPLTAAACTGSLSLWWCPTPPLSSPLWCCITRWICGTTTFPR